MALINKNCIRNASIISNETTDLLVVNRVLYNRSLRASHAAEIEEKASFVREHPFFQNWAQKHKKQMVYSLKKELVHYDSTIIKQGEPASILFFLMKYVDWVGASNFEIGKRNIAVWRTRCAPVKDNPHHPLLWQPRGGVHLVKNV